MVFLSINRVLSGKYQDPENMPKDGRLNLFKGFMNRYRNSESDQAVTEYVKVAAMVRFATMVGRVRERESVRRVKTV